MKVMIPILTDQSNISLKLDFELKKQKTVFVHLNLDFNIWQLLYTEKGEKVIGVDYDNLKITKVVFKRYMLL